MPCRSPIAAALAVLIAGTSACATQDEQIQRQMEQMRRELAESRRSNEALADRLRQMDGRLSLQVDATRTPPPSAPQYTGAVPTLPVIKASPAAPAPAAKSLARPKGGARRVGSNIHVPGQEPLTFRNIDGEGRVVGEDGEPVEPRRSTLPPRELDLPRATDLHGAAADDADDPREEPAIQVADVPPLPVVRVGDHDAAPRAGGAVGQGATRRTPGSADSTPLPIVTAPREEPLPIVTAPREEPLPIVSAPREEPLPIVTAPREEPLPIATAPREEPLPIVTAPREEPLPIVTAPRDTPTVAAMQPRQVPAPAPREPEAPQLTQRAPEVAPPASPDGDPVMLYQASLDALRGGQHDTAVAGFRALIERHPEHELADNALYWQGEADYDRRHFDGALQLFQRVMVEYPLGNKVPDAMLKIGLCFQNLGEPRLAREILEQIGAIYPSSDAAHVARQRLQTLAGAIQ